MQPQGRMVFGSLLMVVGVLLLLDTLRVMDFSSVVDTFWPLLFVAVGLYMIFRRRPPPKSKESPAEHHAFGTVHTESAADNIHHSNIFDNFSLRVTSPSFRGGDVSTVFGETTLDLSGCAIAEGEQNLTISGIFGSCAVLLPKGAQYTVTAHSVFGSLSTPDGRREGISSTMSYGSPGFSSAGNKLRMDISQVFGNVRIEA